MSSQNGPLPPQGGPQNRGVGRQTHGGSIDPYAMSFDTHDGAPRQTSYNSQSSTSMSSVKALPPTPQSPNHHQSMPHQPISPLPNQQSPIQQSPTHYQPEQYQPTPQSLMYQPSEQYQPVQYQVSQQPPLQQPPVQYQPGQYQSAQQPPAQQPLTSRTGPTRQSTGEIIRVPVGTRSMNYQPNITTYEQPQVSSHPNPSHGTPTKESDMQATEVEVIKLEDPLGSRVPRTSLRGYVGNFFLKSSSFRLIKSPHSIQNPGHEYDKGIDFRHKDSLERVYKGHHDDRYLDPIDGRVKELVVQCTDRVYHGPRNSRYKRTFIRNVAPITLRIASWPMDHLDSGPEKKNSKNVGIFLMIIKWPITCYVLNHLIGVPGLSSTGLIVNDGCYDPFPYRYWGYCKVTRNTVEQSSRASPISISNSPGQGADASDLHPNRLLEPTYLCFITEEKRSRRRLVSDWKNDAENQHHHKKCPEYLFIAYTTEHFNHSSLADVQALHTIAIKATREAGLEAYWIGVSCMHENEEDMEDDIFRISDVVRGAHSLVIVVGPGQRDLEGQSSTQSMLQHWGERLWTLPEALLSTPQRPISVYRRGHDQPLIVPKKQFAALAWTDSPTTRQLIDHYEGNLNLSRLELVIIAMESLFARKTTEYFPGDQSYALMGLLRLRPKIDRTDSPFQAFARLSLANDSDLLLERLMCILPRDPEQHWADMSDAYGVKLWDIYPTCQIAGICDKNTVLIDGAFGATIHWDRFRKVANSRRRRSMKRLATQLSLHGAPYAFAVGLVLFRAAFDAVDFLEGVEKVPGLPGKNSVDIVKHWALLIGSIGIILFAFACMVFVSSPYLTRVLYGGKFWSTQAWLFGFEGYADIETIESQIFGSRQRRLRWSAFGSPLSRHHRNDFDECVGDDPTTDPDVAQKVEAAIANESPDAMRIFTLVDTNTMTVTLFEARRPPVALLLCGVEGGMQRAVGCSYEWWTGTCHRETVLRVETTVLEKLSRVKRFRFGVGGV